MVKKLLTLALGLMLCIGASAQSKSVSISASDVQFWTGTGSNSTLVCIGWDDADNSAGYTPTVVVWGIHWNGTITLLDALDTIHAYDSRFTYTLSGSFLSTLDYNDVAAGIHLSPSASWNCNNYNGVYGSTNLSTNWLRISESTCSNYDFTTINNLIYASDPNSTPSLPDTVDASIAFSDILYWVGTGSDSAVLIVNYAQPDTAFAWGYLFNGTTTAQAMVNAIDAADPRFWVEGNPSASGDLHFLLDNGDTLGLSPVDPAVGYNFWWTNLNGVSAASGASSTLHNGDVFKYGDMNSATGWDYMYGYYLEEAWNTIPTPVPAPTDPNIVEEATIEASDIVYWVGTGSNQAILAVNWADTALAWGYRWNGTATVADMMDDIAAADPRFSYTGTGFINDILFNDGTVSLAGTPGNFWGSTNNGFTDMGMSQTLSDGDLEKWADPAAGVIVDSASYEYNGVTYWYYIYAYPMTIHPVSEPGIIEATIATSDILYWVGNGSNQAILAVNWADTALAWGYRWNGTATVSDMMTDIAAADPRLTVEGTGYIDDIRYIDTAAGMTDTLHITPGNYWGSTNNGFTDMGMGQTLTDGDLEKWADPAAGVIVDSSSYEYNGVTYWYYIYTYPMTIHPVTVPDTTGGQGPVDPEHGPFCGAVGTEGCDAIAADSNIIVAWATACTVERGPVDITNPDGPRVHYGTESMGVGPATTSTTSAVSLGDGGTATVTFALPIANGEGPDFAVFENSFNDYFLELGFVEVSSDGQRFVRFPATSLTPTDVQVVSSVDPTYINNLAGKYRVGYGTPFDLEELRDSTGIDLNNITHVRIVDVIGIIDPQYASYDAYGHIVNDPWPTNDTVYGNGGFDLTGVAVINQNTNGIANADETSVSIYPNPTASRLVVSTMHAAKAQLFDFAGRLVAEPMLNAGRNTIDLGQLPAGVYMLRVDGVTKKVVKL